MQDFKPRYLVDGPFDTIDLQKKLDDRVSQGWDVRYILNHGDHAVVVCFFRLDPTNDSESSVRFKDVDPPALA